MHMYLLHETQRKKVETKTNSICVYLSKFVRQTVATTYMYVHVNTFKC